MARLTWDTFPKTGSAWLAHTLEASFPNDEVVWGGHRAATLRYEANVVTTLRHPAPTIASYLVFFQHDQPDRLLDWYCRFTTAIIDYHDRVVVAAFEDITAQPHQVMVAYGQRFRLDVPQPVTTAEIRRRTQQMHPAHLPRALDEVRVSAVEAVKAASLLPDAVRLYEKARALCVEVS